MAAPVRTAASASDDAAPPSPYDPAYDFRKDPNALSGGRWPAWNRYQQRQEKLRARARVHAQVHEARPHEFENTCDSL